MKETDYVVRTHMNGPLVHLNKKDIQLLDDAIEKCHIIDTKATIKAVAAYWGWCKHNNRPAILIRPERKNDDVIVDFITVAGSKDYSDETTQKIEELVLQYRSICSLDRFCRWVEYSHASI